MVSRLHVDSLYIEGHFDFAFEGNCFNLDSLNSYGPLIG